jgi:hypothetical protein
MNPSGWRKTQGNSAKILEGDGLAMLLHVLKTSRMSSDVLR